MKDKIELAQTKDLLGLDIEYSTRDPFYKTKERQHIKEATEAFLASGGVVTQHKRGESGYLLGTYTFKKGDRSNYHRWNLKISKYNWKRGLDFASQPQ